MIEARALCKSFGGVPALAGVSLTLAPAETLVVLGPSGCGKTTLLRLLAGLERPDCGEVSIDGALVSGAGRLVAPHQRGVGMIFQDLALWPHLNVFDNVAFGLPGRRAAVRGTVEQVLARVGLGSLQRRLPHQLSGGERQRLAIARALAGERRWLLLDEPFSSLDPLLRRRIAVLLRTLRAEAGFGILYVTHDLHDALTLGDRILLLHQGRLVAALDRTATAAMTPEGLLEWYAKTIEPDPD